MQMLNDIATPALLSVMLLIAMAAILTAVVMVRDATRQLDEMASNYIRLTEVNALLQAAVQDRMYEKEEQMKHSCEPDDEDDGGTYDVLEHTPEVMEVVEVVKPKKHKPVAWKTGRFESREDLENFVFKKLANGWTQTKIANSAKITVSLAHRIKTGELAYTGEHA